MEEIVIKLDIPSELKEEFRSALAKGIKDLVLDVEFAIADSITSKSNLSEEQSNELVRKIEAKVSKRHGL